MLLLCSVPLQSHLKSAVFLPVPLFNCLKGCPLILFRVVVVWAYLDLAWHCKWRIAGCDHTLSNAHIRNHVTHHGIIIIGSILQSNDFQLEPTQQIPVIMQPVICLNLSLTSGSDLHVSVFVCVCESNKSKCQIRCCCCSKLLFTAKVTLRGSIVYFMFLLIKPIKHWLVNLVLSAVVQILCQLSR